MIVGLEAYRTNTATEEQPSAAEEEHCFVLATQNVSAIWREANQHHQERTHNAHTDDSPPVVRGGLHLHPYLYARSGEGLEANLAPPAPAHARPRGDARRVRV